MMTRTPESAANVGGPVRLPAVIFILVALVASALASQDHQFVVCVDFDEDGSPDSELRESVYPSPNDWATAYVLVRRRPGVADPATGFYSVSFRIYITPGTSLETRYLNLLPGGLEMGSWESGITLVSADGAEIECIEDEYVFAARIDMRYSGAPGDIRIYSHPEYAKWIADCSMPEPLVHSFCVASHGGLGKVPDNAEPDCHFSDIARPMTWGTIKALYAP